MRIKVLENTSEQLIVRMVPTAAPVVVGCGLLLLLAGPWVVWVLGYTTDLELQSDELQFRRAFLGRFDVEERVIPIEEVQNVDTQVYASMGQTLDVTIRTQSGDLRVPFSNLDGDAKIALASRLSNAIANAEDFSENSGMGTPMLGFFLGAALALGGLICLVMLQTSTVVGSKGEGWLGVRTSRWLIPYNRESSIELTEFETINHVEVEVNTHSAPSASSNSVFVKTKSGKALPLAAGPMFTDESTAEIKQIVGEWVRTANRSAS
jgi:membrane protein YdbS with pleckstrin-like domain